MAAFEDPQRGWGGDTFVVAMAYGLATGRFNHEAFGLGIAAGAAAEATPGTEPYHRRDAEHVLVRARQAG